MTDSSGSIDGFDPLATGYAADENEALLNQANRRIVQNILKSYTGYFDLFSETLQNSLDAMEAKQRMAGEDYQPKVWITVDIPNSRVRVVDNGTGMSLDQFKFFLKPNVSFKQPKEARGQKGVGATFLAYGFSVLRAHTRKAGHEVAAILRNGRQWAQDYSESIPRPAFEAESFKVPELGLGDDGTAVEVILGGLAGERPRDLGWLGARNAKQWYEVLRIKSPLGGVYLNTGKFRPHVSIKVVDIDNTITTHDALQPEYFYPHEMADLKSATVKDVEQALSKIQGSPDQRFAKLASDFKRLDCLWEIYTKEDLADETGWFASALTDEHRSLIERHNVVAYACFLRSAKIWGSFNDDELMLRKGQRVIHGGLQMASDFMVQGDLSIIPLTSTIGYQANSHVVVHFTDGSPDMGRKVFQPELTDLGETIAVRCVTIFKRYLQHLKPDTGAVAVAPDKELHEWKKRQEEYRDKNSISLVTPGGTLALLSKPQQEQDVIALFHELIGLGVLRGYQFFATSQSDRYDSLFQLSYHDESDTKFSKENRPLGVDSGLNFPFLSEPRVLEYKYDLDALIREFLSEAKYAKHINLVVCWSAEKQWREKYFLNSLLVGDEGGARLAYGATHQAFPDSGGSQPDFEVLILEDLINFLVNPVEEQARQKSKYKD
ncbi:ATP-binding protein [Sphingosinithalassobacter sp. CS137]|uniref:ATP-binding protein n=1 Tax=Sphingosinithalassobacter sp. CS137 TaxID=2762748 RepID=UPI00165E079E|nr:ATP-binding protein [Sphingosinithalassobacter sp. CS137]